MNIMQTLQFLLISIIVIGIFLLGFLFGRGIKPAKEPLEYPAEDDTELFEKEISENREKIEDIKSELYGAPDDDKEARIEESNR